MCDWLPLEWATQLPGQSLGPGMEAGALMGFWGGQTGGRTSLSSMALPMLHGGIYCPLTFALPY